MVRSVFWIAFATVVVVSAGKCPAPQKYDYPSNDLLVTSNSSPEACCAQCQAKITCQAYVFNTQSKNCILKSAIGDATPCAICQSGVIPIGICRVPQKYDYPSNDLSITSNSSPEACCAQCQFKSKCKAYVFNTQSKNCILKSAIGEATPCAICQSGIAATNTRQNH
jgi:hypothetical protein